MVEHVVSNWPEDGTVATMWNEEGVVHIGGEMAIQQVPEKLKRLYSERGRMF